MIHLSWLTDTHNKWDWSDDDKLMLQFFSQYQNQEAQVEIEDNTSKSIVVQSTPFTPLYNILNTMKIINWSDIRIKFKFIKIFSKGDLAEKLFHVRDRNYSNDYIFYSKWIIQNDNSTLIDNNLINSLKMSIYLDEKWVKLLDDFKKGVHFDLLYQLYAEK